MKKPLIVAFYKAKYGAWDDKFIDFGSGRKGYSHCEVMINPTTMVGAHYLAGGVRKFYYNNIFDDPRWDTIEITTVNSKAVKQFMKNAVGTKYDIGVVCSFLGIDKCLDESKTWCSKVIAQALGLRDENLMPNELYSVLINDLKGKHIYRTNAQQKKRKKLPEIDRFGRVRYGG